MASKGQKRLKKRKLVKLRAFPMGKLPRGKNVNTAPTTYTPTAWSTFRLGTTKKPRLNRTDGTRSFKFLTQALGVPPKYAIFTLHERGSQLRNF